MKIIKFGGQSLDNGTGIHNAINILVKRKMDREKIGVILSARGQTTNMLETLLAEAKKGNNYEDLLSDFKNYQVKPLISIDYSKEFKLIDDILKGVALIKDYSLKVKDLLLAQGELMAVKIVSALLNKKEIATEIVDTRNILKTDNSFGAGTILDDISQKLTRKHFKSLPHQNIPIITGFIASNQKNETTTLGRNGSNYSASLMARYLDADELINYTHIDGIYTANPDLVSNARIIKELHYDEASELASFGANILHAKTIGPLINNKIPLKVLNTFNAKSNGTLIHHNIKSTGIKSITAQDDRALITIEGKGLLGKIGIDARIFSCLNNLDISVGIVSQGSSETAVSFIIPKDAAASAKDALSKEFQNEISNHDISSISSRTNLSVITIIGQTINEFAPSLKYLEENNIQILLINNTISTNNIGLVIDQKDLIKAINIIHSQVFGVLKTINIAVIGKGTVGSALINQIIQSQDSIKEKKCTHLNIFAIAASKKVIFYKDGFHEQWQSQFNAAPESTNIASKIIEYAEENHLENLIAIDNTASKEFVQNYTSLIEAGFDLVSSNKIANTLEYSAYQELRESIKKNKKQYLYETNVGAGLPIIDTIRILHESGENITRIRGVFSGSLSFIFNSFSESEEPFSQFLKTAVESGFTEPDPREDLCGNDVARKLLILARELELSNEFEDILIENLIPKELRALDKTSFLNSQDVLNKYFQNIKDKLEDGDVLRYVGDLKIQQGSTKGELSVELISTPQNSALGNLSGSDSIVEIFTESYGTNAIKIIGAGAGAEVTARGVFGDLLRIADKK